MSGITKAFSGVRVLDDVSFELQPGEVHVLAGENGAGKSTLMKILSGVYSDYHGAILLDNQPVRFSSPHDAARHGISIIHQELSLINTMSVSDNIFLGRERSSAGLWLRQNEQLKMAQQYIGRLDLDVDVRLPVGEFPLPVRQMIEVARALAFKTRVLIMDEPTSSLNEPEVERLFRLIRELKQECSIVYITHKMDEIYRLADRITVLRDGRHIVTESAGTLTRSELVKKLVGRELSDQFPVRQPAVGSVAIEVKQLSIPQPPGKSNAQVRDVSFTAKAGEIVGFGGLQGCGNSELFHGLFGAYGQRAQGDITVDGKKYTPRSPDHAIKSRLALLTNDRKGDGLVPVMNISRNISLASIKKMSQGGWLRKGKEAEIAGRYRTQLNIRSASGDQEVRELSGGNQQKVVMAKWLETQPRILLLDEPTRGVDVGAKQEIYAWMNRWTAEGMTILLITSELPELLALSDRIYVMHRGTISAGFSRGEATQENVMRAAM
jgi:ribose transport system ATP-binding protein